jgi:hypothetical protein
VDWAELAWPAATFACVLVFDEVTFDVVFNEVVAFLDDEVVDAAYIFMVPSATGAFVRDSPATFNFVCTPLLVVATLVLSASGFLTTPVL